MTEQEEAQTWQPAERSYHEAVQQIRALESTNAELRKQVEATWLELAPIDGTESLAKAVANAIERRNKESLQLDSLLMEAEKQVQELTAERDRFKSYYDDHELLAKIFGDTEPTEQAIYDRSLELERRADRAEALAALAVRMADIAVTSRPIRLGHQNTKLVYVCGLCSYEWPEDEVLERQHAEGCPVADYAELEQAT